MDKHTVTGLNEDVSHIRVQAVLLVPEETVPLLGNSQGLSNERQAETLTRQTRPGRGTVPRETVISN